MSSPLDIERYEIKYYFPNKLVPELQAQIAPYLELDPFSKEQPDYYYTIRSIYYDSPDLGFYYEKMDGLRIRKKLRVRVYNEPLPNNPVFLEIKRRYGKVIYKERLKVNFDQVETICLSRKNPNGFGDFCNNGTRIIGKWLYNLAHLNLRPTELVTYQRMAYKGIMDETVRLTIDKKVRTRMYPALHEIYGEDDFTTITDDLNILELKFYGRMPQWLRTLSYKFDIRAQSISKYCNGIDACRKKFNSHNKGAIYV